MNIHGLGSSDNVGGIRNFQNQPIEQKQALDDAKKIGSSKLAGSSASAKPAKGMGGILSFPENAASALLGKTAGNAFKDQPDGKVKVTVLSDTSLELPCTVPSLLLANLSEQFSKENIDPSEVFKTASLLTSQAKEKEIRSL